jgi:hypothetical protein
MIAGVNAYRNPYRLLPYSPPKVNTSWVEFSLPNSWSAPCISCYTPHILSSVWIWSFSLRSLLPRFMTYAVVRADSQAVLCSGSPSLVMPHWLYALEVGEKTKRVSWERCTSTVGLPPLLVRKVISNKLCIAQHFAYLSVHSFSYLLAKYEGGW